MRWTRCVECFTAVVVATVCRPASQDAESAQSPAARAEVAAALQRYQEVARRVDANAIAEFYSPGATLFKPGTPPVHGRDSIRVFMASFPGVRVEIAEASPDATEVYGATAYLWGSHFERLALPGQPVSEQHEKFVTQWMRQPDGRWFIHRFFRAPAPARPATAPPAQGPLFSELSRPAPRAAAAHLLPIHSCRTGYHTFRRRSR